MDILGKHEQRVLNTIDQDALLKSVCSLVSIPSLGGFETPAQEWVASLLSDIGLEVDVWELDFPSLSGHPGYSTEIDRDHGPPTPGAPRAYSDANTLPDGFRRGRGRS